MFHNSKTFSIFNKNPIYNTVANDLQITKKRGLDLSTYQLYMYYQKSVTRPFTTNIYTCIYT